MNIKIATTHLLALGLILSGCATVTRGTTTRFRVVSVPPGAFAKTSTGFSCATTPCTLKMPRKSPFELTFTMAGYDSQSVHVNSRVGGAGAAGFVGNAVAGGIIGGAIDASDGAMNDLVPNPVVVTLIPTKTEAPPAAAAASQ